MSIEALPAYVTLRLLLYRFNIRPASGMSRSKNSRGLVTAVRIHAAVANRRHGSGAWLETPRCCAKSMAICWHNVTFP